MCSCPPHSQIKMSHNVYGILLESTPRSYSRELFGKLCSFVKERGAADLVLGGSIANILREMLSCGLLTKATENEPEYDKLAAGIDRAFKISPSNQSEMEIFTPEKCRQIRYDVISALLTELEDVPFYACKVSDLSASCKQHWKSLAKNYSAEKRARMEPEPVELLEENTETPQKTVETLQETSKENPVQEKSVQENTETPQETIETTPENTETPKETPPENTETTQETTKENPVLPVLTTEKTPQENVYQPEKIIEEYLNQNHAKKVMEEKMHEQAETTKKYIEEKARQHQEAERRREKFYEEQRQYSEMVRREREAEEIRKLALEQLRSEMKAELK